jgi:hypothetical protein
VDPSISVVRHERVEVALVTLLRGPERCVVAEKPDPPVPVADQVRYSHGSTAPVVRHDGVRAVDPRRPVDEHQCGAVALLHEQWRQIAAGRGDDDQAVDAAAGERGEQGASARRILVEASGQYGHTAGQCDVLDRAMQGSGEGVADIFQDETETRRPAIPAA